MVDKKKKNIPEEARGKPRVSYDDEVLIRCKDWSEFKKHYAENLSEGGIFIKQDNPFSPGTYFRLSIKVDQKELDLNAQVVWTKEFNTEDGRPSGIGARFVELTDEEVKTLQEFTAEAETE